MESATRNLVVERTSPVVRTRSYNGFLSESKKEVGRQTRARPVEYDSFFVKQRLMSWRSRVVVKPNGSVRSIPGRLVRAVDAAQVVGERDYDDPHGDTQNGRRSQVPVCKTPLNYTTRASSAARTNCSHSSRVLPAPEAPVSIGSDRVDIAASPEQWDRSLGWIHVQPHTRRGKPASLGGAHAARDRSKRHHHRKSMVHLGPISRHRRSRATAWPPPGPPRILRVCGGRSALERACAALLRPQTAAIATRVRGPAQRNYLSATQSDSGFLTVGIFLLSRLAQCFGYTHLPELDGLRHAHRDSPNMGCRNTFFRGYADYMQTP
jgi:hypothetical protein